MRNALLLFAAALCFSVAAYAQDQILSAQPGVQYGKAITAEGAIDVEALESHLHPISRHFRVSYAARFPLPGSCGQRVFAFIIQPPKK